MNLGGELSLDNIDIGLLKEVPLDICEKYNIIPIGRYNGKVYVAMSSVSAEMIKYLEQNFSTAIVPIKSTEKSIKKLIKDGFGVRIYKKDIDTEGNIINDAISKKASDIHFEPFEKEVLIKYRLNGSLILAFKIDKDKYLNIVTRIKIKSNMDFSDKLRPQDGKMLHNMKNGELLDLRVSTLPTYYGEKIVIRVLYNNWDKYNLESLNFSKDDLSLLKRALAVRNGMIVVNGPTGSGKSTTLYSILNEEKGKDVNITTIEDPVEMLINGINQVGVNIKAGITFSTGLRSILRQDPDIIMIGEIRDEETARIAVRAAITGHKVYTTIHTKSPYEVFSRLKEMGIEEYLLMDSLILVISQRLVKKNCSKCNSLHKISDEIRNKNKISMEVYYKGTGCEECNYTGTQGRMLIYDMLFIKDIEKANIKEYLRGEVGSRFSSSFFTRLKNLLEEGVISLDTYMNFLEGENIEA
ncbi:GspE/PulE family protein [Clostridium sp. YIM B02551]|uniref:GspE/PulE family protein n=1 Tax=Clostridium sp. YIM B02551 TaxID=2910679 RepID=UPI001EEAAB3A|nr:GspE/PulE family protein [Clostridium sp. YIM B02551]